MGVRCLMLRYYRWFCGKKKSIISLNNFGRVEKVVEHERVSSSLERLDKLSRLRMYYDLTFILD